MMGFAVEPPAVTAAMVARSRGLSGPRFSPGGRRLAWVETVAGRSDIVVAPADGSGPAVLVTADAATGPFGAFTWAGPDTVVYAASDGRLVAVPASGGPLRGLSAGADWAFDPAWSPSGRTLAWHEWDFPAMPWDASRIAVRPVDGLAPAGPPEIVAGGDGRIACGQPRFSPAGDALGYVGDGTGWMNVWVAGPDGQG